MNEKAQRYIDEQIANERERYDEEKFSVLKQLGLGEIEYKPKGGKNEDYPEKDDEDKRYRFIPIEITDEEFEELKRHIPSSENIKMGNVAARSPWYHFAIIVTVITGIAMVIGVAAESEVATILCGSVFGYMLFFMLPVICLLTKIEQNQRMK